MNADAKSARDDLAYLKSLVGEDENSTARALGEGYFASGLIYGGQMFLHAAQSLGWIAQSTLIGLVIGLGPTVLFIPVMTWIVLRNRTKQTSGIVGRSIGAVFAIAGMANLFLVIVIGAVAWRERSMPTWLIYPCCVFVLQGAAWLFAYAMRRRAWFLLIAAGWFACAIAMALSVMSIGFYILFAGLGLWVCLALPGWIMMRHASQTG
jgi:hypothetical protein